MKNLSLILSLILTGIIQFNISAQDDMEMIEMSKQERKEWKQLAKGYVRFPEDLKRLYDENDSLRNVATSSGSREKKLKSQLSDKNAKISELQDEIASLKSELSAAKAQPKPQPAPVRKQQAARKPRPQSVEKMVEGIVFKVQIGAFRNKDLSKYFNNHANFGGENAADGLQKITLGQFRDYWEADTFKKYLREMGVKDAWIVPYQDGVRKNIKEVLEAISPPAQGRY